mmetsp:Transcript_21646/g.38172  ORF Transcript_21646/g.38172 Transcript_21646/m.38172 type:complete len:103 (-) Transcript_21646:17-325(-)
MNAVGASLISRKKSLKKMSNNFQMGGNQRRTQVVAKLIITIPLGKLRGRILCHEILLYTFFFLGGNESRTFSEHDTFMRMWSITETKRRGMKQLSPCWSGTL